MPAFGTLRLEKLTPQLVQRWLLRHKAEHELLGHSELRVTADLYSHLQKQTAARAATIMDGVLGG